MERQQQVVPSEASLAAHDPAALKLAAELLLVQAHEARTDPKAFFSLVMRQEIASDGGELRSGGPLTVAPHQCVLFDFVESFPQCVIRMPVGTAKTTTMACYGLWLLGRDPTSRGAIVSATQLQAAKVVRQVADYVTQPNLSPALRLVFPKLRQTQRTQDPWTQTAITVDRPAGIRDPSLVAVGIDGALLGSRLKWALVDDILTQENTSTKEHRKKVHDFFESTVLSRLDPDDSMLVVTNTPWDADDITYRLEGPPARWPTLTMSIEGDITLSNVPYHWDSAAIRPSAKPGDIYRLVEHDPDPIEQAPLWSARYPQAKVDELKRSMLPERYNQMYGCRVRDEVRAKCKREWIERCKKLGSGIGLVSQYRGPHATVTGVDLGVGETDEHGATAMVTLQLLPDGKRLILDVDIGHWDAPTVMRKIINKSHAYNSIVRVENNAAQDFMRQFTLAENASVPIKAHTTGRNKAHPEFGIEGVFVELMNGAWIIPNRGGRCVPDVQALIDGWLNYSPKKHTDDVVMAAWFAREQARELGNGMSPGRSGTPGMNLLSR